MKPKLKKLGDKIFGEGWIERSKNFRKKEEARRLHNLQEKVSKDPQVRGFTKI